MRRVSVADPRSVGLAAFSLGGHSKEVRHAKATLVARLVAQSRTLILSEPQGDKNHAALAIVMGDEEGHEAIAARLASAWNEAAGPDLSSAMPSPAWLGRCRGCGSPVAVVVEVGDRDWLDGEVGKLVTAGLAVDRVPGPVSATGCVCRARETNDAD